MLVATAFSFSGYWHWLMEGLLPLVRLAEAGILDHVDGAVICVDRPAGPNLPDSLRAVGLDPGRVEFASGPFDLALGQIAVPTRHRAAGGVLEDRGEGTVTEAMRERMSHNPGRDMAALRARLGVDIARPLARRLLLSRRDASKRRLRAHAGFG